MLDAAMIFTVLISVALVWLLIHWCADQVESEE